MNYEEKYKEALERAKKLKENPKAIFFEEKNIHVCDYLFPELAESEDEKIRKTLIEYFNAYPKDYYGELKKSHILAWLERQGKQKPPVINFKAKDWYVSKVDGKIHDMTYNPTDMVEPDDYSSIDPHFFKPADNAEPKFKVGEWVVDKQGIVHQITKVIENVTNHTYGYDIVGGGYFNDNTEGIRLWTIQDAKDGDVLCYETEDELRIFIYKNGHIHYHCCYYNGHLTTIDSFFVVEKYLLCYVHPATKEQRELLFQKMKESGYEWDADKKELKKKSQRMVSAEAKESLYGTWSEEDEEMLTEIITDVKLAQERNPQTQINQIIFEEETNWLKSLKQRIGG